MGLGYGEAAKKVLAKWGAQPARWIAEAWLQAHPEPTPRQADAVVEESPYLELDIKQEAAAAFSWEQARSKPRRWPSSRYGLSSTVYLLNYIYMLYCV